MIFFSSLKILFMLANSADPDEMLPFGTLNLDLHSLPKYQFTGIKNEKVKRKQF